ncbi:glycosyltransferase [Nocardioides albus]|uniref:Teichuronic acid biosynthesis glycosyltransferase TuaH n=1 Tax=Nocardioides albus TaxID=1841 RepID=A0A7W5F6H1_9ACTN|nr:glycosyltransferase [Nocardioides albus]MBB3087158.1 teichuronic acid biosynthesis glycosyltransferase TuaH [Nocardioides albus]GGU07048.1 hypothetical protein GCM10007979_00790 [Nocardioides albus]
MSPLLVWLAGVTWDGIRGTDRHLVTALSRHVRVLWVDPPQSPLRAGRPGSVLLGTEVAGVSRLRTVGLPGPDRAGIDRVTYAWLGRALRNAVPAGQPIVLVSTSPHPPLDLIESRRRIYYPTDDFVAGAVLMQKSPRRIASLEARRVHEADVVGAVSQVILDRLGVTSSFVLPNGCDPDAFSRTDELPPHPLVRLPLPVAGLVGQLSPRVDVSLLEAVAHSGMSLLLVGPRQRDFQTSRLDRLIALPNVQWVGARGFEELPGFLRAIDVGITPYVVDGFNRASFPLKTLEYLSAGRPVVSTPLPGTSLLDCPWVRTADDTASFVDRVRDAATSTVDRDAVRRFAAAHAWSERAHEFLRVSGIEPAYAPRR